jgi:DNA processing protein
MTAAHASSRRVRAPAGIGARAAMGERDCWIALSSVPGVGPAAFAQLVAHFGSATAAWQAGSGGLRTVRHLDDESFVAMEALAAHPARAIAARLEEATARAGGRVVTWLDPGYPRALLTLDPRPPTLYVAGSPEVLETRSVAVVGTRRASGYGLATATEIADELARAGVAVVSGLALGIDAAAHHAALDAGGRTIAVLPSPLDRIYPPRNRALAATIVDRGGALITEVPTGRGVGRPDFARRNRIIAGLAEAVVVVEAPDRSGALLTAAAATAIGRELYAVPGPIGAMASRGCNRLIADQHAAIVTSTAALLRQIGFSRRRDPPAVATLSEVEGQVLRRLLERSASIEELVDRTGQPPAAVAGALTLLEARGLANPYGGATFHPTLAARRLAAV